MTTVMYRLVPGAGFVCTVRDGGQVIAEQKHVDIIRLMAWRARYYPHAETVNSISETRPIRRPSARWLMVPIGGGVAWLCPSCRVGIETEPGDALVVPREDAGAVCEHCNRDAFPKALAS